MHCFSLVVCRHPVSKLWLAVNETENRGWWLPGGFVECGEDHYQAAIRETKEESGIDVTLKGILRIENEMRHDGGRQRVVFYAEPTDPDQQPKQHADHESVCAAWLSVVELQQKSTLSPPEGLRGSALLNWSRYIEAGGTIYPLAVFAKEHTRVPER